MSERHCSQDQTNSTFLTRLYGYMVSCRMKQINTSDLLPRSYLPSYFVSYHLFVYINHLDQDVGRRTCIKVWRSDPPRWTLCFFVRTDPLHSKRHSFTVKPLRNSLPPNYPLLQILPRGFVEAQESRGDYLVYT